MTAAQTRLSDHIDVFYGAADRTSDGAMAAHAYKRSVEDLDNGIGRELVHSTPTCSLRNVDTGWFLRLRRMHRTERQLWSPWER